MSNFNNISVEEDSSSSSSSLTIPLRIQFWTYTIADALSILCSLFTLYFILSDRKLRRAPNNHIIIVLLFMGLIYELTYILCDLHRLIYMDPWIQHPIFYLSTFFFDYAIFTTQIILFSWATIERHILTFHDQWLATKKKRLFLHYLPIAFILIYFLIYFSLVTFTPFCEQSFEMFLAIDTYIPCVFSEIFLGTWDLLFHRLIPTLIIVIFSSALILRIVRQKRKMNQAIQWRKHRKMTIQLLSVSALYLLLNSPSTVLIFASQYGVSTSVIEIPMTFAFYLRGYILFLFPFVCSGSLSELRGKLKTLLRIRRHNQIMAGRTLEMKRTIRQ